MTNGHMMHTMPSHVIVGGNGVGPPPDAVAAWVTDQANQQHQQQQMTTVGGGGVGGGGGGGAPGSIASLSPGGESNPASDKPTKKKRKRCGECPGCLKKDNCGECGPCKSVRSHQICKMRKCDQLKTKKEKLREVSVSINLTIVIILSHVIFDILYLYYNHTYIYISIVVSYENSEKYVLKDIVEQQASTIDIELRSIAKCVRVFLESYRFFSLLSIPFLAHYVFRP